VGDEPAGVGRGQHHHAHPVVGGQLVGQAQQLLEQRLVEQVDRAVVEQHPRHTLLQADAQALVAGIVHGDGGHRGARAVAGRPD
jgi:hypothetical protein